VTVVKHLAGDLPGILIDVPKIQQVLINLIGNALQAMDRHGTLTLTTFSGRPGRFLPPDCLTACTLARDAPAVVLRLHDTGPGIPRDQLLRIFDPFFTTKAVGSGTGLGLSVVKKIMDLHSGFIHFRNSPRGGLEVTLAFAAIGKPAGTVAPAAVLVAP
jgi:two-component system, NtrC family, sensor kinase